MLSETRTTPRTYTHEWTTTSVWYRTPGPWGNHERTHTRIRIFEADYYGDGAKRYAECHTSTERDDGYQRPWVSQWQDGNEDKIDRLIAEHDPHYHTDPDETAA